VAYNFSYGAVYCLCLSAVLDLFSFYPYGLQLICYLLTLLALFHLYIKVFTNKSLYSLLLLMIFGVVINELLLVFSHQAYLFYKTNTLSTFDWRIFLRDRILWQMALNCGLTVLIFIGFNVFSKNFKAVFIDTTRR